MLIEGVIHPILRTPTSVPEPAPNPYESTKCQEPGQRPSILSDVNKGARVHKVS